MLYLGLCSAPTMWSSLPDNVKSTDTMTSNVCHHHRSFIFNLPNDSHIAKCFCFHVLYCTFSTMKVSSLYCYVIISFTYPFLNVDALTDHPHISRYFVVRPNLQTPAPIQSSTSSSKISLVFLCFFGLLHFFLVLIFSVFGVILFVQNILIFAF